MQHRKFQKIGSMKDAAINQNRLVSNGLLNTNLIHYVARIKLHGTNAAVGLRFENGEIVETIYQSRERIVTPDNDNASFAREMQTEQSLIDDLNHFICLTLDNSDLIDLPNGKTFSEVYIYGEWVGPRVQQKVALSKLLKRQFFVFQVVIDEKVLSNYEMELLYDSMRYDIFCWENEDLTENGKVQHMHYLPQDFGIEIDFSNPTHSSKVINDYVDVIDKRCPLAASAFGLDGPGEGLVFAPSEPELVKIPELWFKVKGGTHQGKNTVKTVLNERTPPEYKAYADEAITEARLMRGIDYLREMNYPLDKSSIGHYLSWTIKDIKLEVPLSDDLNEKKINSLISNTARAWLIKYLETPDLDA